MENKDNEYSQESGHEAWKKKVESLKEDAAFSRRLHREAEGTFLSTWNKLKFYEYLYLNKST